MRSKLRRKILNRQREWNLCQGQTEQHDDIIDTAIAAILGSIGAVALGFLVIIISEILVGLKGEGF